MKFHVLVFFGKSVEKMQVSSKPDKNDGSFPWRPIYICGVSLSSL